MGHDSWAAVLMHFFLQNTLSPLLDKYFPFQHAGSSQGRWEKRLRCHEQLSSWRLRAWWGLRHGWRTLSLTKSPPKTWARHEGNRSYQWNYSKWTIQINSLEISSRIGAMKETDNRWPKSQLSSFEEKSQFITAATNNDVHHPYLIVHLTNNYCSGQQKLRGWKCLSLWTIQISER